VAIYPELDGIFNQLMGGVIMRKLIIGLMIIGLLVGGYYLAKPALCKAVAVCSSIPCVSSANCGPGCACGIKPGDATGTCY